MTATRRTCTWVILAGTVCLRGAGQTPPPDYGQEGGRGAQSPVRLAPIRLPILAQQVIKPGASRSLLPPAQQRLTGSRNVAAPPILSIYGTSSAANIPAGTLGAASGLIVPNTLIPSVLAEPRQPGPAPRPITVLAIDAASLLGTSPAPRAAAAETEEYGAATGLADDRLGPLRAHFFSFERARMAAAVRPAFLSLPVLGFGPAGPGAALPGFMPLDVLPFPDMRSGGPVAPAAGGYGAVYSNPLTYGGTLGLAIDAAAMLNNRLSMPGLPGLSPGLRY